jgi:hypothetical protein
VILLTAVYTDYFGEESSEVVGVYSDPDKVKEAITAYKKRKKFYNAEVLLDSTVFKTKDLIVDEMPSIDRKKHAAR